MGRQPLQGGLLLLLLPGLAVTLMFTFTPGAQMGVELFEAGKAARVGHQGVAAYVADQVLDRALLVAGTRPTEARAEQVVGAQDAEQLVLDASRAGQDLGDRRLGVVVPELGRNTAEEGKGFDVAG